MKNTNRFVFAVLLVFPFIGCVSQYDSDYVYCFPSDTIDCRKVLSDVVSGSGDTISVSDIVDTVSVVELETIGESLLGDILQLVVTDDIIFVLDLLGSVCIFSNTGKFIHRIPRGAGPGELSFRPSCLVYSETTNFLYVYDYFKVNWYSKDGNFVGYKQLPYFCSEILSIDSLFYIFQDHTGNGEGKSYLFTANLDFDPGQVFMLAENDLFKLASFKSFSHSDNHTVLFTRPLDNNIFGLRKDSLFVMYYIDMAGYQMSISSEKGLEQLSDDTNASLFYYQGSFFENSNYQFFELGNCYYTYYVFRNTTTGRFRCGRTSREDCISALIFGAKIRGVYRDCFFGDCIQLSDDSSLLLSEKNHFISQSDIGKIKRHTPDDNPLIILYRLKDIPADTIPE